MVSAVTPVGWLIVVKVVLVLLLRMNPGVLPPEVNWPTMLPLSLIPKALMAVAGVVRVCNVPPLGRKNAVVPLPPRWPFPGTLSTLVVVELPDRRLMVVDSRRCACGKGGASPALAADRIQSNLAGKRVLVDGRAVGAPQGCAGIVAAVLLRTDFVPLVGRPTVRLTVDLEIEGIKEAVFVPAESCTML